MKKYVFLSSIILFLSSASAQKSSRTANYDIEVSLQPENKTLLGHQVLTWTNTTAVAANELQFHLYLNAFRDENSTFMKESGGQLRGDRIDRKEVANFGNIYLSTLRVVGGENLYPKMRFIQPDDLNHKDKTVMAVRLSNPIAPGQTVKLEMNFKAKLPKIFARTGWGDNDFFMVGQWFPKIGVFQKNGVWNCHQFHANTEFFADFGNYEVKILAPQHFKMAATGQLISEKKMPKNKKITFFKALDVHDFAFAASPHFIVKNEKYKGILLSAFLQPEHASQADRYFQAAKTAINYMQKKIGLYPHPILSLVDPPLAASGAGGMEYPMFITCGSMWGIGHWAKYTEVVTIHEFVHQYFQGILASNEFEESWLDEGFTQYLEGKIMDEAYPNGSQANVLGFTLNDMQASRWGYATLDHPTISQIYRPAWQYPSGTYQVLTYQKTATWLKTLEGILGESVMEEVLRKYFETWKFKHPTALSFIDVVNEVAAKKTKYATMNWFFDQVLFGSSICDYAVTNIVNAPRKALPTGQFTVERMGEMIVPTCIKVVFDDQTFQIINWGGKESLKTYKFGKRIKIVKIDPETKNWMDMNLINNSMAVKAPTKVAVKYANKFLFWVQNIFFLLGGLA
jgi:Peptidase family M1 domain